MYGVMERQVQNKKKKTSQRNKITPEMNSARRTGITVQMQNEHTIPQNQVRIYPSQYKSCADIPEKIDNMECGVIQLAQIEKSDIETKDASDVSKIIEGKIREILAHSAFSELLTTEKNLVILQNIIYNVLAPLEYILEDGANIYFEPSIEEFKANSDSFVEYVNNVLDRIQGGVVFLCNSIKHWSDEINEGRVDFLKSQDHASDVTAIELTGSDLHDKGLGAVFVSFKLYNDGEVKDKTVVIKPENRDIEESLLSNSERSLANRYNAMDWEITDKREAEPKILNAREGKISTIGMKATLGYGTIIEKIAGSQIKNDVNYNLVSTVKSIVFAAMCGLYDLHHENVLWDSHGELYFIDADCALKNDVLNNIAMAQRQRGFPYEFSNAETLIQFLVHDKEIIELTKAAFSEKHGRVTPLYTRYLANLKSVFWQFDEAKRNNYLINIYLDLLLNGGIAKQKVESFPANDIAGPGLKKEAGVEEGIDTEQEKILTYNDLMHGQLPFYEYWYSNGIITHQGATIAAGKDIDRVFAEAFGQRS